MSRTDAQIARDQGVSRNAILERRKEGWTQEEIEAGKRADNRPRARYTTRIAEDLGMSVKEKAKLDGVSASEVYRRYHAAKSGTGKRVRRHSPVKEEG